MFKFLKKWWHGSIDGLIADITAKVQSLETLYELHKDEALKLQQEASAKLQESVAKANESDRAKNIAENLKRLIGIGEDK